MSVIPAQFGQTGDFVSRLLHPFPAQSDTSPNRSDNTTSLLRGSSAMAGDPLGITSLQIAARVQSITLVQQRVVTARPPAGSPSPRGAEIPTSLAERLEQLDPSLREMFFALRELLAKQNPDAARMFEELIARTFHLLDATSSGGPNAAAPAAADANSEHSFAVRSVRFSAAFESTVVSLRVQLEDGTTITAEFVRETFVAELVVEFGESDPLVLDLNGNGRFDTTTPENGHLFDILSNGEPVRVATAAAGDGLLALDRNGNGRIDDGGELFGDQHGAADGFAELAHFDSNGDGRIDRSDPVYNQLQVFQDLNRNGVSERNELQGLTQLEIASLLLSASSAEGFSNGNRIAAVAHFVRDDGSTGRVGDLLLNYLV